MGGGFYIQSEDFSAPEAVLQAGAVPPPSSLRPCEPSSGQIPRSPPPEEAPNPHPLAPDLGAGGRCPECLAFGLPSRPGFLCATAWLPL